ncbi:hypothetical protein F5Y16DRAFT_423858 [Xylariaceae sp. FL0255]|nr:hypothetical protein F5Y16DRAFT_423858 [Xylariaceae sp. FL0255]
MSSGRSMHQQRDRNQHHAEDRTEQAVSPVLGRPLVGSPLPMSPSPSSGLSSADRSSQAGHSHHRHGHHQPAIPHRTRSRGMNNRQYGKINLQENFTQNNYYDHDGHQVHERSHRQHPLGHSYTTHGTHHQHGHSNGKVRQHHDSLSDRPSIPAGPSQNGSEVYPPIVGLHNIHSFTRTPCTSLYTGTSGSSSVQTSTTSAKSKRSKAKSLLRKATKRAGKIMGLDFEIPDEEEKAFKKAQEEAGKELEKERRQERAAAAATSHEELRRRGLRRAATDVELRELASREGVWLESPFRASTRWTDRDEEFGEGLVARIAGNTHDLHHIFLGHDGKLYSCREPRGRGEQTLLTGHQSHTYQQAWRVAQAYLSLCKWI